MPSRDPAAPGPRVRLRAGTPDDAPAAVRTWIAAQQARQGRPVEPERVERVRGYLGKPDAFLVIAEDGGEVVGMALGMQALADDGAGPPLPGRCHVSAVFVHPGRWGLGIGGRLVDEVLAAAAERGYTAVQLWTHADNERALRLYASRGFRRTGRSSVENGERIVQLSIESTG